MSWPPKPHASLTSTPDPGPQAAAASPAHADAHVAGTHTFLRSPMLRPTRALILHTWCKHPTPRTLLHTYVHMGVRVLGRLRPGKAGEGKAAGLGPGSVRGALHTVHCSAIVQTTALAPGQGVLSENTVPEELAPSRVTPAPRRLKPHRRGAEGQVGGVQGRGLPEVPCREEPGWPPAPDPVAQGQGAARPLPSRPPPFPPAPGCE